MPDNLDPLTTEISITANNSTIVEILKDRYVRLDSDEARAELEELYGQVWNADQHAQEFLVEQDDPPYVHVVNRETGQRGSMTYTDTPRFYFLFKPEDANE